MTSFTRKSENRSLRNFIHIYVNGHTEHEYFLLIKKDLRNTNLVIKPHFENAGNPSQLLKRISQEYERNEISKGDRVFCAMDVDEITNQAIQKGIRNKPKRVDLILSNPNFEVWILLHFKYFTHTLMIEETVDKVQEFIPKYSKTDIDPFFDILRKNENYAMINSKRLREFHENSNVDLNTRESNPSTKIDIILDTIKKFVQP